MARLLSTIDVTSGLFPEEFLTKEQLKAAKVRQEQQKQLQPFDVDNNTVASSDVQPSGQTTKGKRKATKESSSTQTQKKRAAASSSTTTQRKQQKGPTKRNKKSLGMNYTAFT
jgi:hypothetical protein